jgi:hypothetical protein
MKTRRKRASYTNYLHFGKYSCRVVEAHNLADNLSKFVNLQVAVLELDIDTSKHIGNNQKVPSLILHF